MTEQAPHTSPESGERSRRLGKRVITAGALAGVVVAGVSGIVATRQNSSPRSALAVAEQSVPPSIPEKLPIRFTPTLEKFMSSVTHAKKHDTFWVAAASFTLHAGALAMDGTGREVTIVEDIDGMSNPAWSPSEEGSAESLCFVREPGNSLCFSLDQGEDLVTAQQFQDDGTFYKVPLSTITREHAADAVVTAANGGFAFGTIHGANGITEENIAGRPVSE